VRPLQIISLKSLFRINLVFLLMFTFFAVASAQEGAEATAEPVAPTPVPAETFAPDVLNLLVGARSDIELMALEWGGVARPEGWSGSLDVNNPQLPLLIRLDLELLVAVQLGETVRPEGWFGAVPSTSFSVARDIRHDVELLADVVYGAGERPEGWAGTPDPLYLCSRATQTLVNLLARGNIFTITTDPTSPDYCAQAEIEVVRFSEQNLLSLPVDQAVFASTVQASLPGAITVDTEFAVGFLDRGAGVSVGVIPSGTPVMPIARSYAEFSNMVLVQNDEFILFMDYRDSTLDELQFEALPNVDAYTGTAPFCSARWCN
jgi:hypothetical protein